MKSLRKSVSHFFKYFTGKQLLIISAIIVGLISGLLAIALKTIVYYIHHFALDNYFFQNNHYLKMFLPLVGILITSFIIQLFLNGNLPRGASDILFSIARKSSILERHKMFSHIITSSITVGLGGSAGLESPIVITGSAVGSNLGSSFYVNYKDRTILLACGSAAGIAAIFNSPIAGLIFALEVLLAEVSISSFIPIIIASVTGTLCSHIILKEDLLFQFKGIAGFNYMNTPYYIVLGILSGIFAIYYAKMYISMEKFFQKFKNRFILRAFVGGFGLVGLCFLFPSLFGEGYESIKALANGNPESLIMNSILEPLIINKWLLLLFVISALFLKVFATSFTLHGGGNGGNFAPSLFVGAYLGFSFSHLLNLSGLSNVSETNFTIVGMAGILSGIFYAPLTAVFLIAEITSGYELILPLMLVSAISYAIVANYNPYSMETRKLAKEGNLVSQTKDRNVLNIIDMKTLIEHDVPCIRQHANLGQLVDLIASSKRNVFAVVDKKNRLQGIILLDHIREIMFTREVYNLIIVRELMTKPPAILKSDEQMTSIMQKFDETGAWNLPVVDNDDVYLGFISKSQIFTKYRSSLIQDIYL